MVGIPKTKRSGGPRTSEGKVSAAKNSFKTGAYSSLVVLPNESEEDFLTLQSQFVESLSPIGIAETALVHDLTVITWKKLRLERLEQSSFVRELNASFHYFELNLKLQLDEGFNWIINHIGLVDDAFVNQSRAHIEYINSLNGYGIPKDEFFALPKLHPSLFEFIQDLALECFETDIRDPQPENMTNLFISDDDGNNVPFTKYALKLALKRARQVIYVSQHLNQIKAAITAYKEKRLLDMMQRQGVMRVADDLSRAYAKTLTELRKQQEWRLKMTPIDVSTE